MKTVNLPKKSKVIKITSEELVSIFLSNDLEEHSFGREAIYLMKRSGLLILELWRSEDLGLWQIRIANIDSQKTERFILGLSDKAGGFEEKLFFLLKNLYFS